MKTINRKRTVRNLIIFTVFVNLFGWCGYAIDRYLISSGELTSEPGPGIFIWLLAPIGVSFALRTLAKDGWRDLGIKPNFLRNIPPYLISLFIYPAGTFLVLLIAPLFGAISYGEISVSNIALFVQPILITVIPWLLFSIFEEFGWRGYLAPKLLALKANPFIVHIIVGVIWAAWHIPYINYINSYTDESLLTFLPRFIIGCIAFAIVYGEVRILTGSVVPAVLMHLVGHIFANPVVEQNPLIKLTPGLEYIGTPGIDGIIVIVFAIIVGISLYVYRKRKHPSLR